MDVGSVIAGAAALALTVVALVVAAALIFGVPDDKPSSHDVDEWTR